MDVVFQEEGEHTVCTLDGIEVDVYEDSYGAKHIAICQGDVNSLAFVSILLKSDVQIKALIEALEKALVLKDQ